jgi:hypothetical protein
VLPPGGNALSIAHECLADPNLNTRGISLLVTSPSVTGDASVAVLTMAYAPAAANVDAARHAAGGRTMGARARARQDALALTRRAEAPCAVVLYLRVGVDEAMRPLEEDAATPAATPPLIEDGALQEEEEGDAGALAVAATEAALRGWRLAGAQLALLGGACPRGALLVAEAVVGVITQVLWAPVGAPGTGGLELQFAAVGLAAQSAAADPAAAAALEQLARPVDAWAWAAAHLMPREELGDAVDRDLRLDAFERELVASRGAAAAAAMRRVVAWAGSLDLHQACELPRVIGGAWMEFSPLRAPGGVVALAPVAEKGAATGPGPRVGTLEAAALAAGAALVSGPIHERGGRVANREEVLLVGFTPAEAAPRVAAALDALMPRGVAAVDVTAWATAWRDKGAAGHLAAGEMTPGARTGLSHAVREGLRVRAAEEQAGRPVAGAPPRPAGMAPTALAPLVSTNPAKSKKVVVLVRTSLEEGRDGTRNVSSLIQQAACGVPSAALGTQDGGVAEIVVMVERCSVSKHVLSEFVIIIVFIAISLKKRLMCPSCRPHVAEDRRAVKCALRTAGAGGLVVLAHADRGARRPSDLRDLLEMAERDGVAVAVVDPGGHPACPLQLLSDGGGGWRMPAGAGVAIDEALAGVLELLERVSLPLCVQHGVYAAQHYAMDRYIEDAKAAPGAAPSLPPVMRAVLRGRELVVFTRISEVSGAPCVGSTLGFVAANVSSAATATVLASSLGCQAAFAAAVCGRTPDVLLSYNGFSIYEGGPQHPLLDAIIDCRVPRGAVVVVTSLDRLTRRKGTIRALVAAARLRDIDIVVLLADAQLLKATEPRHLEAALGNMAPPAGELAALGGVQLNAQLHDAAEILKAARASNRNPAVVPAAITASDPALIWALGGEEHAQDFCLGRARSFRGRVAPAAAPARDAGAQAVIELRAGGGGAPATGDLVAVAAAAAAAVATPRRPRAAATPITVLMNTRQAW